LNLSEGLNVFTGETGAGKSILLDALGLALGERSEAGLVRQGAAQASVTAEFSLPGRHDVYTLATDQGLSVDDPLILRRVIGKDGKSRAFINDQPISIGLLKQFGERLLEIHGQFETHGLLNPATHRGLLDAFANLAALKQTTAATYAAWHQAESQAKEAETERARALAEEDFLRAAVNELDKLAPESGEADILAERRTALQHHEKIVEALQTAEQAFNSERGALASLTLAGKAIARVADKAVSLKSLLDIIDRANAEVAEAAAQVDRALSSTGAEPDALQRIEERLFTLRAVARKHSIAVEALPGLQRDLSNRLAMLTDQGDRLTTLRHQAAAARMAYQTAAESLSAKRKQAAAQLEKAIARELPPLKLERAHFTIEVTQLPTDQWSADGMDRVAFLASTNPGSPAGALNKVASGGELARFMLALKVVLAASDPVPTLIFDEVDSGIGGATASAVGERLAQLAEHVQILVVTHSPQVAARGSTHIQVAKQAKGKNVATEAQLLDSTDRVEEIARMLSGAAITDAARHAAKSLIDGPSSNKSKARKTSGNIR
jgi:DNA repair protein RecN (Recombination protein N)